ncbi:MAG: hypothetical protein R3F49_10285 [Planctomycetota bacterium]
MSKAHLTHRRFTSLGTSPGTSLAAFGTSLLAACAFASAAGAQTQAREWKGGIFRPSTGTWIMEPTPASGLNLLPQDTQSTSSVDILLPPAAHMGVEESVRLDLAALDPTGALLQPGAELTFTSRGEVGGVADQPLGALRLTKQPGGRVQYEYDFSTIGATSYTIEFWLDQTLVGVSTGVPGGLGGGPLLLPNCDAHPWCCWTAQVYYFHGHWYNGWLCAIPIDWQSQIYNCNRVVVTPENPTVSVGDLTSCSIAARGIPSIPLTDMLLTGYGSVGTSYCNANPNSTGLAGVITAVGSNVAAVNQLDLYASQLPNSAFGYFIVSPFQAFVPNAGGAQGNLCVGLSTGRFRSQLGNTGFDGLLSVHVDLTSLPQPNGSVAVQAGETWNFQCWHRDANPSATSNFSAGYSITFE